MKIGKLNLDIKAPANLDSALIALAGVNAAEMADILTRPCIASMVATALVPFAPNAPSRPELAEAIREAGVDGVKADVAKLYQKTGAANGAKEG